MKLPKDIEELKQFFKVLSEPITEPCYRKPKMWYYALGTAAAALLGILSTGVVSYVWHNREIEKKNSELVMHLEKSFEPLDKNMDRLVEKHTLLQEEANNAKEGLAETKTLLEEKIGSYEASVAALKKEIEEKEKKHTAYIQNHPEELTVEKKTEMSTEIAELRKQLEEKIAEYEILQDQIKKNDPSKEISRLTEENKRLQEEANKGKEELAKEKKACAEAMQELEQVRKSRLEELANEPRDDPANLSQEYRERLQRDIELCTKIIASSSDREENKASGYNNRGNIKQKLGLYKEAIADYNESIRLRPSASTYSNRSIAKRKLGLLEEAIQDCDVAIKINPSLIGAYLSRGNAKLKLGRFEDAIKDYDKALELNPDYAIAEFAKREAYEKLREKEKNPPKKHLYLDDFAAAVNTRNKGQIRILLGMGNAFSENLLQQYVAINPSLKIGIGAIWTEDNNHAKSDGFPHDAPSHTPLLTVTLQEFAERLGIERVVNYFTIAYGEGMTYEQMKEYVKTHSLANFASGLSQYYLLLSKEEAEKLDKEKKLNLQEGPNYRHLQILARDIPPEEK